MLDRVTEWHMKGSGATGSPAAYRENLAEERGFITGLTDEVVDILGNYAAMGVEEVQFEHFNFNSDEVPTYLAEELGPLVE